MSENNNEQLTLANALKSMGIQNNNALVNEAFSNLNGVEVVNNLKESHDLYSKPFIDSDMSVGSAIGGSYQLGVATIYREEGQRWKNKAYIFDDFTIQKLKRKYGNSIEHILSQQEQLKQQVQMFTHRKEFIEQMDKKIEKAYNLYQKNATNLSKIRQSRAKELDDAILINLNELMLPNACFKTVFTECNPSEHGNENVEFMISMNKGEELKSLVKTASGGELSRLMLGLKVIFTKLQGIQTVIFDEIDTGVSGPVATAIGQKMKALSNSCQVFAVTHLAQVAACADTHYFVSKEDKDNKTITHVNELDENGRIDQLALISSGSITDISKKAAQELYRRNHS